VGVKKAELKVSRGEGRGRESGGQGEEVDNKGTGKETKFAVGVS
jgi:hypothetical protein